MTLAQEIQNITDRSLFEKLANTVLRQTFPELEHLIASGINEKGETIKGKLDSFTLIEPKHYALIEHTTNDSNLEGKWLYDQLSYSGKKGKPDQGDGDLIKAIKHAKEISQIVSDAKFTIYLTSNQRIDPTLWTKVTTVADQAGVAVKFLEQSNIEDHLNTDPKGQYLRKLYFNRDYDLMSDGAFTELQELNLKHYVTESFINTSAIASTPAISPLKIILERSTRQLTMLIAESGIGKSTLCYSYITALHEKGEKAIRVDPELVEQSFDLDHLLQKFVQYYRPKIFWSKDALDLIKKTSLCIIVDDLNNFGNPLNVLNKLIAWSLAAPKTSHEIRIICPIWPQYFQQITDLKNKSAAFTEFRLGKPDLPAAKIMLQQNIEASGVRLTSLQEEAVIDAAGFDPLLIGLCAQLINEHGVYDTTQSGIVIEDFVNDKIAAASKSLRIAMPRLRCFIQVLGEWMIKEKNIKPSYDQIAGWMEDLPDSLKILDEFIVSSDLMKLSSEQQIQFRHDRIRNYFLLAGFLKILPTLQQHPEKFADPFFCGQLGMAISEQETDTAGIEKLLEINPEAVFYALRYLQSDQQAVYFDRIVSQIAQWKATAAYQNQHETVIESIIWDLLETDTKKIRLITEKMPYDRILFLAELRNGDVMGGIKYFSSFGDFEPCFNNALRNSVISHVRAAQPAITGHLNRLLNSGTLTHTGMQGAYLLAGYLGNEDFAPALNNCWTSKTEQDLYPYYIWAILRCASRFYRSELESALAYFHQLPDEGHEQHGMPIGERNMMLFTFSHLRWHLKAEQIELLNELYDANQVLLNNVFGYIDHSQAIARIVNQTGEILEQAHPQSSYSISHPDDRWSYKKNGCRLSDASLEYLKATWSDKTLSRKVREVAVRFWTDNVPNKKAIEGMRMISAEDTDLYEGVIWRRALLGDHDVTSEFLKILKVKLHWIRIIDNIWNAECKLFYQELLNQYPDGFKNFDLEEDFAKVLRSIPESNAEELLIKNWQLFKAGPAGVQTALYIATEATKTLAAAVIITSNAPKGYLQHVGYRFGYFDTEREKRLTIEKFQALEPYLDLMSAFSLKELAEQCFRSHFQNWLYDVLLPHLEENDAAYFQPSISDLIIEIRKQLNINNPFISRHSLDTFNRRNLKPELAIKALEEWIKEENSVKSFKFLGDCLVEIGNRNDLKMMENFQVARNQIEEIEEIKKATTYLVCKRSLS
jgi:hypothetical protein